MICMGMSGNGSRITSMKITTALLQTVAPGKMKIAHTGYLVGGAGTAMPFCAARLVDSSAILRTI